MLNNTLGQSDPDLHWELHLNAVLIKTLNVDVLIM